MIDDNKEPDTIFKVVFTQDHKVYELYARYLTDESIAGFIEIEELLFDEFASEIVINTAEQKLRDEFKGVERVYIPMHHVLRVDEVKKQGVAKITDRNSSQNKVTALYPNTGTHQHEPENV